MNRWRRRLDEPCALRHAPKSIQPSSPQCRGSIRKTTHRLSHFFNPLMKKQYCGRFDSGPEEASPRIFPISRADQDACLPLAVQDNAVAAQAKAAWRRSHPGDDPATQVRSACCLQGCTPAGAGTTGRCSGEIADSVPAGGTVTARQCFRRQRRAAGLIIASERREKIRPDADRPSSSAVPAAGVAPRHHGHRPGAGHH